MSLIPTKESVIGTFINPRRADNDFLQLQDSRGGTIFGWVDSDGHLQGSLLSGISAGVGSLNGLLGAITLAAGTNVTIVPIGNTLTFNAFGTIGGSIAAGQVAVSSGINTISGSAALTFSGGNLTETGNILLTGNFTETGVMTVTGPAIAGTTPGNFISTHNGPTNVLDSVLSLSNSGGGPIAYIGRSTTGALFITNDGAAIPNKGFFQFSSAGDVQLLAGANGAALAMNVVAGTFPAGSVAWSLPDTGVGTARFHLSTGTTNVAWDWDTGTGRTTMFGSTSGSAAFGVAAVAGTPNPLQLPITTGAAGQVLTTDGGNPQQLSWTGGGVGTVTNTIASGTAVLGTTLIGSGAKASTVTVSAPNVLATDNVMADFSVDPTSTTGYSPSASGMLTIIKFCTAGNVNFIVVNNTGGSITPGAVTLDWRVVR